MRHFRHLKDTVKNICVRVCVSNPKKTFLNIFSTFLLIKITKKVLKTTFKKRIPFSNFVLCLFAFINFDKICRLWSFSFNLVFFSFLLPLIIIFKDLPIFHFFNKKMTIVKVYLTLVFFWFQKKCSWLWFGFKYSKNYQFLKSLHF